MIQPTVAWRAKRCAFTRAIAERLMSRRPWIEVRGLVAAVLGLTAPTLVATTELAPETRRRECR